MSVDLPEGGYRVAMLARNMERLTQFEQEIAETTAYPCDISNEAEVNATVAAVAEQLGPPTVLIHNAVSFDAIFGTFLEIDPTALQHNFQVNTMGLLYMARAVTPYMLEAGQGAIMVTGNTASRRGRPAICRLRSHQNRSADSCRIHRPHPRSARHPRVFSGH